MPSPATPTRRLADLLLGCSLRDWVVERRDTGVSWRLLQRELYETTGGEIDVTYETLRSWFPDLTEGKAS